MNVSFASGLQGYNSAVAQLNRAADKVVSGVRPTASITPVSGDTSPRASAASPTDPIARGGRVSSSQPSVSESMVEMIRANQAAALAATSIRAADDMVGEVLDISA